MSTTMDAPPEAQEQFVAAGPDGVIFLARRRELRLVMTPRYPIHGQAGQKIGETKGSAIQFMDGRYLTADAEELEFLRRHPQLGDVSEGFWEVTPTAPAVTQDEIMLVTETALNFDVDKLTLMLEQEQAGWGRPELLAPISAAIEKITDLQRQIDAQQGA